MSKISFSKMHGNGNDFIIIDEFEKKKVPDQNKADFSIRFCDRHFGIGADGVLFLSDSNRADLKMRLFQPDGSEAEMCGNGICCLVKHACDKKYVSLGSVTVDTMAGILTVYIRKNGTSENTDITFIKVNMGKVRFDRKDIPANGKGTFLEEDMYGYKVSAVNTGVPHCVIFVNDLDIPIKEIAQKIRFDPVFPDGVNVNFVLIKNNSLLIRTYERGVEEETLSCGTGSVACAVVALRLGKVKVKKDEKILVKTNGGNLFIFEEDDCAFMESTAETVYTGILE